MKTPLNLRPHTLALALAAAGLIAACGSDNEDVVDPPAPPATGITLAGVVAKGAALGGASVAVTCATGTGTATTAANGSYSVTITGGALPCVLKATSSDAVTKLHSVAPASTSSSVTVNVTPLTELVVAQLTGKDPATYVAAVVPSTLASTATASAVAAAQTALASTLTAGGLSTSAAGDFISGSLVAANGSTTGNAYDQVLDALNAKLVAGGSTLAALTTTIATNSPAAPPPTPTTGVDTVSLPADLLLKPAAANCSALRSGKYRLVYNREHPVSEGHDTEVLTIDATALTVVNAAGESSTLVANGNCRYKTPANGDMVISAAGIAVLQVQDGSTFHLGVAFPEQIHPVSALAAEWNSVQLDRTEDGGPIVLTNTTGTFDATGRLTAATFCEPGVPCFTGTLAATPDFPVVTHTVNAAGGFNSGNAGSSAVYSDRVFLYRTGGGEFLRVSLTDAGGHLSLWTRKVTGTLPAVGRVSEFWNITQNNNYTASGFSESKNTVRAVDATANSYLRDAVVFQNGTATGVTQPETFRINNPRDGFSLRVGETVTASDGSSRTVSSFIALGLRGTGISAVGFPGNNTLVLSVAKQP